MGVYFFDQYTLLHMAVGVISYFFDIPLSVFIILNIVFEIMENTKQGIHFIDRHLKIWPGGKQDADSLINRVGDIFSGVVGWWMAYQLDELGRKYKWYSYSK